MKNAIIAAVLMVAVHAAAAPYPYTDSFTSAGPDWSTSGLWAVGGGVLTDSPGRLYDNNSDSAAVLSALDLTAAIRPSLVFRHRHFLEEGYDFATLEVSVSGGAWTVLRSFSGNLPDWTRVQTDLSQYAGEASVSLRWRVQSDSSVVADGWYVDDVVVGEAPPVPLLDPITNPEPHRVACTWPAADPSVGSLRLIRTRDATLDWGQWSQVATLAASATNHLDASVSPKTTYYYRLVARGTNGVDSVSPSESVTTPAGMTFPFLDDGEGGGGTWVAIGTWALSDEQAFSATHAWSDSPGTNYANAANSAISLIAPIDLTSSTAPVLTFVHRYQLLSGDLALVELSANNGTDWVELTRFTNAGVDEWRQERLDLSAYTGSNQVRVRFRLSTDGSGQSDGWWIDDIAVSESPIVINGPSISGITSHTLDLAWGLAGEIDFSHYAVHRSVNPDVSFRSPPVARIYDRDNPDWTDTGLSVDTVYYYRIFAVNRFGAYGPVGTENFARTLNHPVPFEDDFNGDLTAWNVTGDWGLEAGVGPDDSACLTDSPAGSYVHNQDTWIQTAVDLRGTSWPVLRFDDWLVLNSGDSVAVEISINGTSWTRIYGQYEVNRPEWRRQEIDLSEWKGQGNVRLRFRINVDNNSSTTAQGWRLDNLEVKEHSPLTIAVPFEEDFEAGLTNWISAAWLTDTNVVYEGGSSAWSGETPNLPGLWYNNPCRNMLTLGGELDLAGLVNPQLTLWAKARLWNDRGYFRVWVSENGGVSWTERSEANLNYNTDTDWVRLQCDLTGYAGKTIRLRLLAYSTSYTPEVQIRVDKLTVAERTPNVLLNGPVPSLKSVDLSWEPSLLGADFQRYELYRHTASGVNLTHTRVGVFTNVTDTTFTDTGLSIGQLYYYRIYQVNQRDTYSSGSERPVNTVPLLIPLADDMDTLGNWDVSGSWGLDSAGPHQGAACLSDSPGDVYIHNNDSWAMTAVNLTGSTWPVLTFWDRLDLAAGDSVAVEISIDGNGWSRVYGQYAVHRPEWRQQQIDLSEWKTRENVRIRFRMNTDNNAATLADGWFIDAVHVGEHSPVAIALPFEEDFEAGLTNWISAAWLTDTNVVYEGGSSAWSGETPNLPGLWYNNPCRNMLTLGGELDLAGLVNPQLTLWAKARLWNERGYFRVWVSENGGVNWTERGEANLNYNTDTDWVRLQCDLASYAGKTIRLRLLAYSTSYTPEVQIRVDKLTVAERTPNVLLNGPVPSLKSVDLSWEPSLLGAEFQRYELYRHTAAGVNLTHTRVGVFTNLTDTTFTDTDLSIGQLYYYRIYQIDQRDMYSLGSERSVTTVPLVLPVVDGMESLANWDVSGTWGVDAANPQEGSFCLSDSPGDLYQHNLDTWAMTAVNLQGTTWPVLTFWDRLDLSTGDAAAVEVSSNGSAWYRVYGQYQVIRPGWRRQQIDLSEWRNQENVRIRFRVNFDNNASSVADGWAIDAVRVEEHVPQNIPLPFREDFEGGLTNWIAAAWIPGTNQVYEGSASAWSGETPNLPGLWYNNSCRNMLTLGGELDFSGLTNPQLTLWAKARLWNERGYFRVWVSENGGLNWTERSEANLSYNTDTDWVRLQCDLSTYADKRVRLRLAAYSTSYTPEVQIRVDKLTVAERTPDVTLDSMTPAPKSVALAWTPSELGADFKRYEIYRDTAGGVSLADVLVGSITNLSITNLVDTGLVPGQTYFYRVFVVDQRDMYSLGSERSIVASPTVYEFDEPFDDLAIWHTTGLWGLESGMLSDSPGLFYPHNSDTEARTSVSLVGATWPILRFRDRYDLVDGDGAAVEVSANGTSWTRLYGIYQGRRDTWRENVVDLSQWKGQPNLRIRFRLFTNNDANTTAEGWRIDDVFVGEHTPFVLPEPFFESFENGADLWLKSDWTITSETPFEGAACLRDGGTQFHPDGGYSATSVTYQWLVLGAPIDLRGLTVAPTFSFRIKGFLRNSSYAYFRTQISSDEGLTWQELPEANRNVGWNSDWEGVLCDLTPHLGKVLRLRFQLYGYRYSPEMDLFIDNIGIGGPAPGAPVPFAPFDHEQVTVLQPTLMITNAFDPQSDPLTYAFEVYADAALSNRIANVPALASGSGTTAWTIDQNLVDGGEYWWRVRASDGGTNGPWSAVFSFTINHDNFPPHPVELVGPPRNGVMQTLDNELVWKATADPDYGDPVSAYHIQIARDEAFQEIVVDVPNIPSPPGLPEGNWALAYRLGDLAGSQNLVRQNRYYWRMRARDPSFAWSAWSQGPAWFQYGTPPLHLVTPQFLPGGQMRFQWELTGSAVVMEFTPTLNPPDWQPVIPATYDNQCVVTNAPGTAMGFYRLVDP